jgi:DNA-binding CsgD family transcriptional regulator
MKTTLVIGEDEYVLVPESGCWLWTKGVNECGYGRKNIKGKLKFVHRIMYEDIVGEIPKDICVLHKCDVRCCINPNHLFLGTHKDNMRDAVNKGRHKSPNKFTKEKHPLRKYSIEIHNYIINSDKTNKKLSEELGISRKYIWQIRKRNK